MTKFEELIKSKGKTKCSLAEAIGMSRPTFDNRCENPLKFEIMEFIILSEELGMTVKELFKELKLEI